MEAGRIEFIHRSWPADSAQLAVIRHELSGWLAPLRLTDEETCGCQKLCAPYATC
jgi:serine/threonine-protein kinase RsbW